MGAEGIGMSVTVQDLNGRLQAIRARVPSPATNFFLLPAAWSPWLRQTTFWTLETENAAC